MRHRTLELKIRRYSISRKTEQSSKEQGRTIVGTSEGGR